MVFILDYLLFFRLLLKKIYIYISRKIFNFFFREEAAAWLRPHQLGFNVAGGCEAAVHAARSFIGQRLEGNEPFVVLKVDFCNAFNTIRRDTILEVVYDKFPAIYNFVSAADGRESSLLFRESVIGSAEGVQQGDPMGPLLFPIAIPAIIVQLRSFLNSWFLVNGTMHSGI